MAVRAKIGPMIQRLVVDGESLLVSTDAKSGLGGKVCRRIGYASKVQTPGEKQRSG